MDFHANLHAYGIAHQHGNGVPDRHYDADGNVIVHAVPLVNKVAHANRYADELANAIAYVDHLFPDGDGSGGGEVPDAVRP